MVQQPQATASIAPLVERLLGPVRFAVVYLFAGLGGALLMQGWFPTLVSAGASAAINGVFGAFVACYLRAPRTIPVRLLVKPTGLILLYAAVSLLTDYLGLEKTFIGHLGGFLFGLVGGLLFGPELRRGGRLLRLGKTVFVTTCCAGIVGITAWGMAKCADRTVALLAKYDAAMDRERALLGRFTDGIKRWQEGGLKDADLRRLLHDQLIPEWNRFRDDLKLKLPPDLADLERQRLSVHDLLEMERESKGLHKPKKPANPQLEADRKGKNSRQPESATKSADQEFDTTYRIYLKLRVDSWQSLSDALNDDDQTAALAALDLVFVEFLREGLDEMANEDNPLRKWVEFSPRRRRDKK
jgi:hypothetical protein